MLSVIMTTWDSMLSKPPKSFFIGINRRWRQLDGVDIGHIKNFSRFNKLVHRITPSPKT